MTWNRQPIAFDFRHAADCLARSDSSQRVILERFWSRLRHVEASLSRDRRRGLDLEGSHRSRAIRWEAAYRLQSKIKRFLLSEESIPPSTRQFAGAMLRRALELARENPLQFIGSGASVHVVRRERFRCAFPRGEAFQFLCLHRGTWFYTEPYQITYSCTPPGHEQEVHGHFFTNELTVALDEGLGFKLFRFRDDEVIACEAFPVAPFHGARFAVKTPHAIYNTTGDRHTGNATVKFREQVTDRWSLDEGPPERQYTYDGCIVAPRVDRRKGHARYSFDKMVLVQRIVCLEPDSSYVPEPDIDGDRGVFVVRGAVQVASRQGRRLSAEAGDVVFVAGPMDAVPALVNRASSEAVLIEIDLRQPIRSRLDQATARPLRALAVATEGVLTNPETGGWCGRALHDLLQRARDGLEVLVIAADERESRSLRTAVSAEAAVERPWLGRFLVATPGAQLVSNRYPEGHPHQCLWRVETDRPDHDDLLRWFADHVQREEQEVISIGSRGGVGEPHHAFVSREGGFTTDTFDPAHERVVALRHLCGFPPGGRSFRWALDRFPQDEGGLRDA